MSPQAQPQNEIDEISKSFAFTTRLDEIVAWGRKNSLWPLPYGTACCGIELMSVMGPKYDLARFGAEVVRFSPRQADLLLVAGTITEKMGPILVHIYEQMLASKDPAVRLWGAKGIAAIAGDLKKVGGNTLSRATIALKTAEAAESSDVIKEQIEKTLSLF